MANNAISMCPANMFANSRIASEAGRTINTETISIGVIKMYISHGTPGGKIELIMYFGPCATKPAITYTNHTITAATNGIAIRDVAGKITTGTVDHIFIENSQKKSVPKNGVHL